MLEKKQTYVAQVKIKYLKMDEETGLMPDGKKIDIKQIVSSEVLENTIKDLNLPMTQEELRSGISIKESLKEDDAALKDSMIQEAKEFEIYANEYIIKFEAQNGISAKKAQQILNSIIDNYSKWYGTYYLSYQQLTNNAEKVLTNDYDYLQSVDLLEEEIEELKTFVEYKKEDAPNFESKKTGYAFQDIYSRLTLSESTYIDKLYSQILYKKFTKNEEELLKLYQKKLDEEMIIQSMNLEQAEKTKDLMDTYADKMKKSYQNDEAKRDTYSSYYDIDDEVENGQKYTDINSKTTYDTLIEQYVNYNIKARKNQEKIDFYQKIIDIFLQDDIEVNEDNNITIESINNEITNLANNINDLYHIILLTMEDYNDYMIAKHIQIMGTTSTYQSVNVKLYSAIAIVFCMGFGILAILFLHFLNIRFSEKIINGQEKEREDST